MARLVTVEKEVEVLQGRLSRAASVEKELKVLQEQTKESTDSASACHFALQKVNNTLKERLAKTKKQNEELMGHKDELLKKQVHAQGLNLHFWGVYDCTWKCAALFLRISALFQ